MYHPTTRLLTVLELLQSHPQLSGPELAERLEVDVRTVRRYVTMLQDLGIPIEGEIGRHGGYALRPGYKLPPLMFNEDEVVALTVGLMLARQVGLATTATAAEGALAKVERVLPAGLRERTRAVQATVGLELGESEIAVDSAVLSALSVAVQERQQVEFRYKSSGVEWTERLVDPYGIAIYEGRWYLAGYCHMRGDVRVFRLDRIADVENGADHFEPPPGFDALEHIIRRFAVIPDRWGFVVLFYANIEQVRSKVPRAYGILTEHPEGTLLTSSTDDLDSAARFLINTGFKMAIIEPPELRAAFGRLADEIRRLAEEMTTR